MTKPTVSKHWRKPVGRQRSGLNPTRTTAPCYNNTTLGNRLYAQRKGPNVTNRICLTCKNCSHKCAADCEHCHFGDESFQAINCTGTDNQNNETKHYIQNKHKLKKTALHKRTIYTLVLYAFYDHRAVNGARPILTATEPTRSPKFRQHSGKQQQSPAGPILTTPQSAQGLNTRSIELRCDSPDGSSV